MKKWFNTLFKKRDYLTKKQKESLSKDANKQIDELVEKMRKENEEKDEKIHNLMVDILLLENDIIK